MPLGILYSTIDYMFVDFSQIGLLTISGRDKSGKTNLVNYILQTLLCFNVTIETWIIDNDFPQFKSYENSSKMYFSSSKSSMTIIDNVYEELKRRQLQLASNPNYIANIPLCFFIIENKDFFHLFQ